MPTDPVSCYRARDDRPDRDHSYQWHHLYGKGGGGFRSLRVFICTGDQPGLDFGLPRNEDMQGDTAGQILVNPITIIAVTGNEQ
jgi:hypothetical protein